MTLRIILLLLATVVTTQFLSAAEFVLIGATSPEPLSAVSLDGTIVGQNRRTQAAPGDVPGLPLGTDPVVWSRESGLQILDEFVGAARGMGINDISADGQTMVGTRQFYIADDFHHEAFRLDGNLEVPLQLPSGFVESHAFGISSDGRTIFGRVEEFSSFNAFDDRLGFWNEDGMFTFIEGEDYTPIGALISVQGAASLDGRVVVGFDSENDRAWRWTEDTGARLLPRLTNGEVSTQARGLSANGRWAVGRSAAENLVDSQPVVWDGFSEPFTLDVAHEGWGGRALRISEDGSIIAGEVYPTNSSQDKQAALWTEETGFVPLQELLATNYGLAEEVEGWHLHRLQDMSDDGRFLLVSGHHPQLPRYNVLIDLGNQTLPGDYNNNGTVEQGDLDLVLLNWGAAATAVPDTWTNDLPSGTIDQDELDGVLFNWGNTATAAVTSAAVPEPSGAWLVVLLAVGALAHHGVGSLFSRRANALEPPDVVNAAKNDSRPLYRT